jgi:hypothetical protein
MFGYVNAAIPPRSSNTGNKLWCLCYIIGSNPSGMMMALLVRGISA